MSYFLPSALNIYYNFYNTQRMLAGYFVFFRIRGLHCTCFLVTLDIAARGSIDRGVCCSSARPWDSCYTSHLRGHPETKIINAIIIIIIIIITTITIKNPFKQHFVFLPTMFYIIWSMSKQKGNRSFYPT